MKPFRLEAKLRNNRLLQAKEASGLTVDKLCEVAGVHITVYFAYVGLKESPLKKNGEWRKPALALAMALGESPEDLWPDETHKVHRTQFIREFSLQEMLTPAQVAGLLVPSLEPRNPEEILLAKEEAVEVLSKLDKLDKRTRTLILSDAQGMSLEEAGAQFGISKERARQLIFRGRHRLSQRHRLV